MIVVPVRRTARRPRRPASNCFRSALHALDRLLRGVAGLRFYRLVDRPNRRCFRSPAQWPRLPFRTAYQQGRAANGSRRGRLRVAASPKRSDNGLKAGAHSRGNTRPISRQIQSISRRVPAVTGPSYEPRTRARGSAARTRAPVSTAATARVAATGRCRAGRAAAPCRRSDAGWC